MRDAPEKQAGCLSDCHICLCTSGLGFGVCAERELFLAMPEKGMTLAWAENQSWGAFGRRG